MDKRTARQFYIQNGHICLKNNKLAYKKLKIHDQPEATNTVLFCFLFIKDLLQSELSVCLHRKGNLGNDYWLLIALLVFYCRCVADGGIALKSPTLACTDCIIMLAAY